MSVHDADSGSDSETNSESSSSSYSEDESSLVVAGQHKPSLKLPRKSIVDLAKRKMIQQGDDDDDD